MKRIIWFSDSRPSQEQKDELERLFGEIKIIRENRQFDVNDLVEKVKRRSADEIVLDDAPLSFFYELQQHDLQPLSPVTEEINKNIIGVRNLIEIKSKKVEFIKFARVKITYKDIE